MKKSHLEIYQIWSKHDRFWLNFLMDQISEEHCQSVLYPGSVSGSPKRTRNRKEKMFFVKNVKNNFVC